MWADMFVIQIPVLEKILRTVLVYATLVVLFRLAGKRDLAAFNTAVNRWQVASPRARRLLEGTPAPIIKNGHLIKGSLRRLALRPSEVDHAIRVQNGDGVSDIADGRMEPSGQLILSLKSEDQSATKGDISHLNTRLDKIDNLLALLSAHAAR